MTQQISASSTQADTSLITSSRGFVDWLVSRNVSLAISTFQTGKLFLIGRNENGQFSVFERTFERAMGLAGNDQTIYANGRRKFTRVEQLSSIVSKQLRQLFYTDWACY